MKNTLLKTLKYFSSNLSKNNYVYKKQNKPTSNKLEEQFIYGLNSVEAALHSGKRQLYELYISDSEVIQLNSKTMKLINFAKNFNLPLVYTQKQKLDRLVHNSPHQNVVLKCSSLPLNVIEKEDTTNFDSGIYVYTDKITDPQNFGAIIRSSLFFGIKHIFTSKKSHCPLNPTVSKASTGAVELMPISLIQKSEQFFIRWKKEGGSILSTQVSQINQRVYAVQQLQSLKQSDKLQKMLIVLGSEGFGVSPHLKRHSDYSILIQRKGITEYPYNLIDSLNVNAALTAILFELTKDVETNKNHVKENQRI